MNRIHSLILALVLGLLSLTLYACGGGGGGGGAAADTTAPTFSGIVLAYSADDTSIDLHWAPGTDNVTAASSLSYDIYVGTTNSVAAVYNATSIVSTVTGSATTSAVVAGLTPDTTYYALVVARDLAGNEAASATLSEVQTMAAPIVASSFNQAGFSYSAAVTNSPGVADQFQLALADAAALGAGDVVIINAAAGQTLRAITAIDPATGLANTVDASLAQIINSGTISSSAVIADIGTLAASNVRSASAAGVKISQYADPAGAFTITETFYDDPEAERSALAESDLVNYEHVSTLYDGGANGSVKAGYNVTFEPKFNTIAQFTERTLAPDRLDFVRLQAVGEFTFDGIVGYYLNAATSNTSTKTLFEKTISLQYSAGPVPVQQDVTMEMIAEISYAADAALTVESKLSATKQLVLGVRWERGGVPEFGIIKNDKFTKELTFTVLAEGGLTATVKLYPRIETTFYKAATAALSVQPGVSVSAAAAANALTLDLDLTQFDVSMGVDLGVEASLQIFKIDILDWSDSVNILTETLHSLPTLDSLACDKSTLTSASDTATCTLTMTDGTGNAVLGKNVTWTSVPAGAFTYTNVVTTGTDDPTDTTFTQTVLITPTGTQSGAIEIWASAYGDGFLGSVGNQDQMFAVTYTPPAATTFSGSGTLNDGSGDLVQITNMVINPGGTISGSVAVHSTDLGLITTTFTGTWTGSSFASSAMSFSAYPEIGTFTFTGTFNISAGTASGTVYDDTPGPISNVITMTKQ